WKTRERMKPASERKREEIGLLWTAALKLRAVALLEGEDVQLLSYQDLMQAGIWSAEQASVFDLNMPIVEYTLNEFWRTLVSLSWDWPSLTIGPVIARFLDALW